MSDSPSLIEDIFIRLKADVLSGAYLPGERIDIGDVLKRFHASKTPILLVLNRLVGEGLLEARPHEGYYIPRLTTESLRQIYECDAKILMLVLDNAVAAGVAPPENAHLEASPTDSVVDTERLFTTIAGLAGNREITRIVAGLNDRLRPLRRLKAKAAIYPPSELNPLKEAWTAGDLRHLKALVRDYHYRRMARLPEFIALAYTGPPTRHL